MARTRSAARQEVLPLRRLPAAALRAVLREGYGLGDLRADVLAGAVVGIVALPLAMALAIAVGVAPQHGLYTAIVAGFVVALLGGSRTQVTGPTAAFIVILAPIGVKFGLAGLLLSALMGGLMLAALGALRLGRFIEFIPHPVTTGFTAGIAVVIATLQVKDLLGLHPSTSPDHYVERVVALVQARDTASGSELAIGLFTLALLIAMPRVTRRVPAPLVALPVAALAAWWLESAYPGHAVETIQTRFRGIPGTPPLPSWPWLAPGADGAPLPLTLATLRELLPGAFAVAILGAIESLLSAVVSDGMARTRHDPDAELLALGVGNVAASFFGGIPATGAIARTATNVRSGARSPFASMTHALVVLAAVVALAPAIVHLPMASLAALLLLVAWNMSDAKHFVRIVRLAPRSDVAVLLTCFGLTVLVDMVIAVSVGVVLAALLFMRRMAEVTHARLVHGEHPALPVPIPSGAVVYDLAGPLFFGAAQRALGALGAISDGARIVIFDMAQVPVMDATGLVAFESALEELHRQGRVAILSGLQKQPRHILRRSGTLDRVPGTVLCATLPHALLVAESHPARLSAAAAPAR